MHTRFECIGKLSNYPPVHFAIFGVARPGKASDNFPANVHRPLMERAMPGKIGMRKATIPYKYSTPVIFHWDNPFH